MQIYLIGMMGAGKTSVGIKLAKKLGYSIRDTDHMIESIMHEKISTIFELKGEEYFRNLETKCLTNFIPPYIHCVVATGGGVPLRNENMKIMRQRGKIIYLKVRKSNLIDRLQYDTKHRPLLNVTDWKGHVDSLLMERGKCYEKADIIIEADGDTKSVVDKIIDKLHAKGFLNKSYK